MCTTTPATKFSPTLVTATAGSTPAFWMKRVLSAMPPRPAGASLLAKADATWARNVGIDGRRWFTDPMTASVAPTKVEGRHHHHGHEPRPLRVADLVEDVADVAELRDEEVRRECERRDREQLAPAEPLQLRERGRRVDAVALDLVPEVVEQLAVLLEAGARRARERAGLQEGERGAQRLGAEHARPRCRPSGCAPTARPSATRTWARSVASARSLAATSANAKSISHGAPSCVDDHVRAPEVAVGDAVLAHDRGPAARAPRGGSR